MPGWAHSARKREACGAGKMRPWTGGHAVLELALLVPWVLFLFVGAFDWGFYAWALISTESAARVAAMYTSTSSGTASDSIGACDYAAAELAYAPNIASSTWVNSASLPSSSTGLATCSGTALTVVAAAVTGPDGSSASQVTVTYQTPLLIQIPGLLPGQISITRSVQMRVRS
jgi:hypothetical protein